MMRHAGGFRDEAAPDRRWWGETLPLRRALMRGALLLVAVALLSALPAVRAQDNADDERAQAVARAEETLDKAAERLKTGSSRRALSYFKRVLKTEPDGLLKPKDYARALVGAALAARRLGKYDAALALLKDGRWDARREPSKARALRPVRLALADLLLYRTDYAAAGPVIEALVASDGSDPIARVLEAQHYYATGRETLAAQALGTALAYEVQQQDGLKEGPQAVARWIALGKAHYLRDRIQRDPGLRAALEAFREAKRLDPENVEALTWCGRLMLENGKQVDARKDYLLKALAVNPGDVAARAWLSRTYAFQWASFKAGTEANKALESGPDTVEALQLMAEIKAGDQRYDLAWDFLARALAIAPNNLDLLAQKALLSLQTRRHDQFAKIEARVLAQAPKRSEFYATLVAGLVEQHRFDEAIAFAKKGLALDENDWDIHKDVGFAYARLGNEELAFEHLKKANRQDALRNRLFTLNLLQVLRVIQEEFAEFKTADGNFVIKLPKAQAKLMLPYLKRYLGQAFAALSKKYAFTPRTPILFELFGRRDDFAARSIALPSIPALGVCFGQYVTMLSPSLFGQRDGVVFSWAKTLRHEMDHVFQIQLTKGRVPRWLAEGLSVYEERRARPEWDREMDLEMIKAYSEDRLFKLAEVNKAFRNMGTIMFGYYQSSYMCEFIAETHGGFATIRRLLEAFGRDEDVASIVKRELGLTLEQFDVAFRAWVKTKFIAPNRLLPGYSTAELQKLKFALEDNPEDAELRAKLGAAYFGLGNLVDARTHTGVALKLAPRQPLATAIMARITLAEARERQDPALEAEGRDLIERALALGVEDFFLYLELARIYAAEDPKYAIELYQSAKSCFPRYVGPGNPYQALIKLYGEANQAAKVRRETIQYCRINELELRGRAQLAQQAEAVGAWGIAKRYWEEVINLAPIPPAGDVRVHLKLANAAARSGDHDQAAFEYQVALAFEDPNQRAALLKSWARELEAAGKLKEAIAALDQLLIEEPENTAARTKRRELKRRLQSEKPPGNDG